MIIFVEYVLPLSELCSMHINTTGVHYSIHKNVEKVLNRLVCTFHNVMWYILYKNAPLFSTLQEMQTKKKERTLQENSMRG